MAPGLPQRRPRRAARRRRAPVGRPGPRRGRQRRRPVPAAADHHRPVPGRRCRSRGAASTSPSPPRSWPPSGAVPAGVGRPAGPARRARPRRLRPRHPRRAAGRARRRRGPGTRRWWCRPPTPTRRRSSTASRCCRRRTLAEAGRPSRRPGAPDPGTSAARCRRRRRRPTSRRGRAGVGTAGRRGRGRRRAPPVPDRPAGRGQDDAGRAAARPAARRWTSRRRSRSPRIHSVAGTLPPEAPLVRRPTFEAPHHSATMAVADRRRLGADPARARSAGRTAASSSWTRRRSSRARCSTPCGSRWSAGPVTIHRAAGSATFPCRAQLVLAANPCPCATRGRRHGLHVQPARAPALPVAAVRAAARPDRPAGRSPAGHAGGLAGRRGAAGDHRGRRGAGRGRPGRGGRAGWPAPGCR